MNNIKIGEYRLLPKGSEIWSIKNQSNLITTVDEIIEIEQTCIGSDGIFVKPKQLLFNYIGYIPTLIDNGDDEWSIRYSETLPYTIPEARF